MKLAIAATEPLSSISLPNSAPSRNSGKNCAMKARGAAHEGLRPVGQQRLAGEQRRDQGRQRRQQQHAPAAEGERDQQAEAEQDAEKSHRHHCSIRQQRVEIERWIACRYRRHARRGMRSAALAALVAQHARRTPIRHSASTTRRARPCTSLMIRWMRIPAQRAPSPCAGVGDLAQQRHHAQFLHQRRVEGHLVEPVEDVARGARRCRAARPD